MFLGWFDDTKQKSATKKIEEAVERYVAKFGEAPDICLVSQTDLTTYDGVEVKVADYVRPNHFWVGRGELLETRSQAA